ncbi:MAG: hypothetical protein WBB85_12970 [Albidovulum sp.]|uniref:hypothetical protein n=1 Tax=Albidovulum sp. TaxID=1872424 RepID=UPI003CA31F1F
MMMKQILFAVGLGAAGLGVGAGVTVLSGPDTPTPDAAEQAELAELAAALKEEEDFLRILPAEPEPENAALVPHATPEEAAVIAADFFARPAPTDAELAAMVPFEGAENVPLQRCDAYFPNAAKKELDVMKNPPDRRMKGEIYARMNVRRALDTGECTCTGKVAPYEPVAIVLAEIKRRHGEPDGALFYPYRDETARLRRAVERLCGGYF